MRLFSCGRVLLAIASVLCTWARADAQPLQVQGFADVGVMVFSASDTFNAVFGSPSGVVIGGGASVILPQGVFVSARASRFKKDGERVFVDNGEVFHLGITNTVTITPFEVSAGYRVGGARDRARPYAAGGVSWYRYKETDEFATGAGDEVNETFNGFHVLGGIEARASRFVGLAGEVQWTRVPDAIGQQPGSVGAAFDETDLGGFTFRAKVVFGR